MTGRTLILWRHGRTAYNAAGRLQGQVDIPLDEVGQWQARTAAAMLALAHVPTRIVSSDLSRAVATAATLADLVDLPVELDPRMRERSFGDWDGLSADEIGARWPEEHAVWRAGGDPDREGAETRREVAERMVAGVREHLGRMPGDGTLVVVSHGAAITLTLTALLELDPETWRGVAGLHNAHWAVLRATQGDAVPAVRLVGLGLGPAVHVDDWNRGVPTEASPSSAADAMRA